MRYAPVCHDRVGIFGAYGDALEREDVVASGILAIAYTEVLVDITAA